MDGEQRAGGDDPELAAFVARANRPTGDDDPELLAFEAGERRRNVVVYLIGGVVAMALGGFFSALALTLHLEHRVLGAGLSIFTLGVACIVASWRLRHGAPVNPPDVGVGEPSEVQSRRSRRLTRLGAATIALGLMTFAIATATGRSGVEPIGIGLFFGGVMCLGRAFAAKPSRRSDEDPAG